jgi:hypothetical protein
MQPVILRDVVTPLLDPSIAGKSAPPGHVAALRARCAHGEAPSVSSGRSDD